MSLMIIKDLVKELLKMDQNKGLIISVFHRVEDQNEMPALFEPEFINDHGDDVILTCSNLLEPGTVDKIIEGIEFDEIEVKLNKNNNIDFRKAKTKRKSHLHLVVNNK